MNLKEGIRVYSRQIENIKDQISINSGVLPVHNTNPEIEYYHNAYLPNPEWRALTDWEYKQIFTANEDSRMFNTLGMGEIPRSLEKLFQNLKLNECESLFDVPKQFEKNEELIRKLNEELNTFLDQKSVTGNYKFHRIARSLPDMQSTTFHHTGDNTFKYTGLHIDKSIFFTPHTAYKSDNRISINVSAESRFLYFINLTLRQIYTKIQKKNSEKITSENIVEEFFKLYPHYPVLRLEIKPYQYYIAPTDNFIHDGTTLGNKFFDITMVYTGVFDKY
ncbi:hypothetical protein C1631_014625 [Chryseobacterium phosphatilyticum]|uniref:Uncharacterized protein n=1 Tax=Chryseobacterium phosphatilyticum TaxID=475075 RepID=A0A316X6I3_9FLAO|nr:hypothetical protein [Chryseobacterium phosphatilyticum]PWN69287.1 hypothetical protein C1631_014625 [Chryseobacterium phosphatilyticum]